MPAESMMTYLFDRCSLSNEAIDASLHENE